MDKPEPKYIYVADQIRKAIKNRTITDKLPGERTLAKDFGFSYMTIRKAIDRLVTEGVLFKNATKGTFVAKQRAARKKTNNIGYFLDSSIKGGLTSPYYALIFNALEKEANRNGYALMYFSDINAANVMVKMSKIDGIIVSCFPRIEEIVHDIKKQSPLVVIDNSSSDKSIPSIIIDNFNGVVDSIDYLNSLGHKRIGFMMGLEDSDVGNSRYAGYKSALSSHGLHADESLVFRGNYTFESGLAGADYFISLAPPPTAIMCANDSMAIGAIKMLSQSDIRVPDDISIIGFDDIAIASHMTPPLTTVSAPVDDIAVLSFKMLNSLIKGQQLDNRHIALPCNLIVRETCADIRHATVAA